MKLNVHALGLACGVISGAMAFLFLFISAATGYGKEMIAMATSVYPWVSATYIGALLGLVCGFIKGYIFGVVVAFAYNKFCNVV